MAVKMHILVCGGTGCSASASHEIVEELNKELVAHDLTDFAKVVVTGCFGFCERGPIVKIIPDNTFYTRVKPSDAKEIIEEHIIKGRKVQRLLYSTRSSSASPCATAVSSIPRTSRNPLRVTATPPWASASPR